MKKKIINLLFNDFTNDNRVLKESRSLVKAGYEVELLATHFDSKLSNKETIEGIKVIRVNVGRLKLLPWNLIRFWIKAVTKYRKEKIFHCNDLYALPPAWFIKKFISQDVKIVYDCHEHETEAQIYIGKPIIKLLAKLFERIMIYDADKVISVSTSIADDYVRLYDIERPKLVLNTPYYQEYKGYDLFRKELGIPKDKIIFLFQGGYISGRGIDSLLNIFEILEKENPQLVLAFLVYGKGKEELKKIVNNHNNMYWHEKVTPLVYMKYVSSADWGIYLMEDLCLNHQYALPNKIFDYALGGLPVVVSNLKEMSKFVKDNKIGYVVNPENIKETVAILKKIDSKTKTNFVQNLKNIAREYNWENQEKVLLNIYSSL